LYLFVHAGGILKVKTFLLNRANLDDRDWALLSLKSATHLIVYFSELLN
jgi:hypothetical protein